jgi:hypothetical protein
MANRILGASQAIFGLRGIGFSLATGFQLGHMSVR